MSLDNIKYDIYKLSELINSEDLKCIDVINLIDNLKKDVILLGEIYVWRYNYIS